MDKFHEERSMDYYKKLMSFYGTINNVSNSNLKKN